MRTLTSPTLLSALLLLLSTTVSAQTDVTINDRSSVSLTIYNNDLGVVRDVRTVDVKAGANQLRLRDVPSEIDPSTVKVIWKKHPDAIEVVEQDYQFDLVNQVKLLNRYIDRQITAIDEKGAAISGTLLSVGRDGLVLKTTQGITMLPGMEKYRISVESLPSGLITRPTLLWQLESDGAFAREPVEVLYQTGGMSWHAEYIVALGVNDDILDLSGWVSLENTSGATFENADLKLVAGAVNRVRDRYYESDGDDPFGMFGGRRSRATQFEERGMFEYHLYDLGRKTSLLNNQIKQISLLEAMDVKALKKYTYRGGTNVAVTVEFANLQNNHLGMPLPEGIVRVMKKDKDGEMEFVGEDRIRHTPRDEKVSLKVGDAFDMLGERVVTDHRNIGAHARQETIEITIKNRKDTDETIEIIEDLGPNWDITRNSHDFTKRDARTIVIPVKAKARSELKVTYTVIYGLVR